MPDEIQPPRPDRRSSDPDVKRVVVEALASHESHVDEQIKESREHYTNETNKAIDMGLSSFKKAGWVANATFGGVIAVLFVGVVVWMVNLVTKLIDNQNANHSNELKALNAQHEEQVRRLEERTKMDRDDSRREFDRIHEDQVRKWQAIDAMNRGFTAISAGITTNTDALKVMVEEMKKVKRSPPDDPPAEPLSVMPRLMPFSGVPILS